MRKSTDHLQVNLLSFGHFFVHCYHCSLEVGEDLEKKINQLVSTFSGDMVMVCLTLTLTLTLSHPDLFSVKC